ncbi:OmpA family protein [Candidatus Dependentiae bacterium]|nr:OmpA family protein [Candidatus Dependentiae bacterium]
MNIRSIKFFTASLILLSFLGGCKKNKQGKIEKTNKLKKGKQTKYQNSDAFDLDSDSMKSFAIDDKISKHKSSSENENKSPLFSWEDAGAEESKKQFHTLYFDFDKDYIKPNEETKLEQDIAEAKKMIKKGKTIVIEGHACHSAGSRAYNMALSERRARFVASRFAEAGINAADIKIAPRGQEMPVIKGGNREQQAPNRRVEIFAIDSK